MPSANNTNVVGKMTKRRRRHISADLRALAKATALPNMVEAPVPKGNNPTARRIRRMARKGWLVGCPTPAILK